MQIILAKHSIFNIPSTLIRIALPESLFRIGRTSHAIIVDGDYCIEAKMLYLDGWKIGTGVRRVLKEVALDKAIVVATLDFKVPDEEAGLAWARQQVGKPYDFFGALELALAPDRNWHEDDAWYCYELAAEALHQAGRKLFSDIGHITGRELLGVNPE